MPYSWGQFNRDNRDGFTMTTAPTNFTTHFYAFDGGIMFPGHPSVCCPFETTY